MSKRSVLVYLTAIVFATASGMAYYVYQRPLTKSEDKALFHENQAISPLALLLLANIAESTDNFPLALSHYTELLALQGNPEIAEHATDLALNLGEVELARALAEQWASLASQDLQAQLVAMTLFLGKDNTKSQYYLEQAIQADPLELGGQLALIQSQLGASGREALYQTLKKGESTQTENPYFLYALAQTAVYEKAFSEGETYLNKSLQQKPDFSPAIELKAKLIRQASPNDNAALTYLETQKTRFPANARLQRFYVEALVDGQHFSKAITELKTLLQQEPESGALLLLLGEVYELAGQSAQATQYLEQATKKMSNPFSVHYLLGLIYHKQDQWPLALNHLAKVTEGTFYVPAILSRALILNEQAQFEESLNLLRQADPSDFTEQKQLLLLELDTLIQAKHITEAKALLQEVLGSLPQDPDFLEKSEKLRLLP